jgi:hypothetical protein
VLVRVEAARTAVCSLPLVHHCLFHPLLHAMQPVVLVLLVTAALASLAIASEPASAPCGVVFDGARKGDIDLQRATDSIAAHWFDFEDGLERNRVLRYEWAVVSESMTTPALKCMCWCEGSRVRAWLGGWVWLRSATVDRRRGIGVVVNVTRSEKQSMVHST